MKNILKEYEYIEKEFFDIDEKTKKAKIKLHFKKATDIFDVTYLSETPILSDEFISWIQSAFDIVPAKYRIDLSVTFDDLCGFEEKELKEVFLKNTLLEYKSRSGVHRKRTKTAYFLIGVGITVLIGMILLGTLWDSESVLKTILSYAADIAATVTIWEALTILVVERSEEFGRVRDLVTRFDEIVFSLKTKE